MTQTTSMQTNSIAQFADFLMTEAKLNLLPEDFKQTYREKLSQQIATRIGLTLLRELNEADATTFNERFLGETIPDLADMQDFLADRLPEAQTKLRDTLEDFAAEFFAAIVQASTPPVTPNQN